MEPSKETETAKMPDQISAHSSDPNGNASSHRVLDASAVAPTKRESLNQETSANAPTTQHAVDDTKKQYAEKYDDTKGSTAAAANHRESSLQGKESVDTHEHPQVPGTDSTTDIIEQEAIKPDEAAQASGLTETNHPQTSGRPESLLVSPLTHPNGVDMFPTLSATEQEQMSWEAFTQAEESIVAEDASRGFRDDTSDGGYESEGFSSGSTSAESSVRDYMYENGRRYHRFREGAYNFPNDDVEQEREDMKHAMVKLLCGQKLFFSPIGDNPQQILDIGTGTGIWVIESEPSPFAFCMKNCIGN